MTPVGTGPPRQPWRVLVLGNSMPTIVAPARRSRQEGTYVEVLEWLLRDAGYEVAMRNSSRAFDQIHQGTRRFVQVERMDFPDVLIVHYGLNECRPPVVPWMTLKHLHKTNKGLWQPARTYRRLVTPHVWRMIRRYQTFASARVGQRTWRMSPTRFRLELARLIELARQERMLVLVADVNPPGRRIGELIPGLVERCQRYRGLVADVVSGCEDDDVRLVPVSAIVEELGVDEGLPDSLHLSATGHQRLAEMLSAEIAPWLDAQGARRQERARR